MDRPLFQDLQRYFTMTRSLYQVALFTQVVLDHQDSVRPRDLPLALYQVVSHLVQHPEPPLIHLLSRTTARMFKGSTQRFDPHEAELFLLMNRPPERSVATQQLITKTIFARLDIHPSIDPIAVQWALMGIGTLTHSYEKWRVDALSLPARDDAPAEPSLLEMYTFGDAEKGFGARGDRSWGGAQIFVNSDRLAALGVLSDSSTAQNDQATALVIDRRGLLLSSHNGTLFIRSSSPAFGRQKATYSAYFSAVPFDSGGFSESDLRSLSSLVFEQCTPVSALITQEGFDPSIVLSMTKSILNYFDGFRRYKFDTSPATAWGDLFDRGESSDLIGAHLSPGFAGFIERCVYQIEQSESTVQLAFGHPAFPGWQPYRFLDREGVSRSSLLLGKEELAALRALAQLRPDLEILDHLGIRQFIQQAGLSRAAELYAIID
jgi:hypothetical protein